MKETPLLYTKEMVLAVLADLKTNTRRVMKPQPIEIGNSLQLGPHGLKMGKELFAKKYSPYGGPRDRLWVKEPFKITGRWGRNVGGIYTHTGDEFKKTLTHDEFEKFMNWKNPYGGKSSLFMFRSLSRITLEITDVRVERVQDISADDCFNEGIFISQPSGANIENIKKPEEFDSWNKKKQDEFINGHARATYIAQCEHCDQYIAAFEKLWNSINGTPRADGVDISWAANPWVWVIAFRRMENIGSGMTYGASERQIRRMKGGVE